MSHHPSPLGPLRRPALLIRAARAGLPLYRRGRDLRRLLGQIEAPAPGFALGDLISGEAAHEARRLAADVTYDPARHVEFLIALLAEARLATTPAETANMAAPSPRPQPRPSPIRATSPASQPAPQTEAHPHPSAPALIRPIRGAA